MNAANEYIHSPSAAALKAGKDFISHYAEPTGTMGLAVKRPFHFQAIASTQELVQKDRLKELDRIATNAERDPTAEYANYVLLPMLFIVGLIVVLRRLLVA